MIAFLSFALPFTLYLSLPSTFWNFDGVACAAALELGQMSYLFHANHLLYGFLGFLFWKGIGLPLGLSRSLPALQLFTSLLSCVGLVGLYQLLQSITQHRVSAMLLTLSMAVTAAFWVWSVEAQVYALGFLPLAWATYLLLHSEEPKRSVWVGMLHGAAVLGHLMHFLWVIPALFWFKNDQKAIRPYITTLLLTTITPYVLVVGFVIAPGRDLHRILIWLKGSVGLTADRHWSWHSVGWQGPWIYTKSTILSFWGSFWPYGNTGVSFWLWIVAGLSIVHFVFLIMRGWPQKVDKASRFAWLWLGVYGLFLSTWEPATLCYRMTDIIPFGILLALGLKTWKPTPQILIALSLLISTLSVNLLTRVMPMHRVELNSTYQEVLSLSKMTPPDSLYITNGGLPWIYLLYFTGRTAWNALSYEPHQLDQAILREKRSRSVYVLKGSSWQLIH